MRTTNLLGLGLLQGATVLLIGCGPAAEPLSEPPSPVEQSVPAAPAVAPAVSVNAVMVALVDHAGHAIWDAGREGQAPQTDADWLEIEHHAIQIAAAGSWVAQGGSGEADPGWFGYPTGRCMRRS